MLLPLKAKWFYWLPFTHYLNLHICNPPENNHFYLQCCNPFEAPNDCGQIRVLNTSALRAKFGVALLTAIWCICCCNFSLVLSTFNLNNTSFGVWGSLLITSNKSRLPKERAPKRVWEHSIPLKQNIYSLMVIFKSIRPECPFVRQRNKNQQQQKYYLLSAFAHRVFENILLI